MSLDFEHFIGLNAIPQGALFHPDGQKYLFSSGALIVIGDLIDPHTQDFLRGHDDSVTTFAVSRSGTLIASGQTGTRADIIVWDYATRRILYRFEEHDHAIQALAFSEDGKILASIGNSDDGNLILWDMSNGCIITSAARIPAGTTCITFAGFVKDIKRRDTSHYQFYTGGRDGVMIAWDLDPYTGEMTQTRVVTDNARANLTRHILGLAVSADYETIYAGTTSGDYLIISIKNQRILRAVTATRTAVHSILYTKDMVVLGCGDKSVKIYHTQGDFLRQVDLDGAIYGLSLANDQLEILVTTSFGSIIRMNLQTLQQLIISEAHSGPITQVAFDMGNAGRFATACAGDNSIKVWDVAEYAVIATCFPRREQKADARPLSIVFADIIISGWSDGRVLAYSAETGENLWMLVDAHIGLSNKDFADEDTICGVTSMVLSHNRRFLLTGGPTGDVRLWELRTRELISHLKEHKQRITRIVLTADDTVALTASKDRCVLRWDLRSEKRVLCHMQRMGGINDVRLLGEREDFLVSVGQDRKLVLWDTKSSDPVFAQLLDVDHEADEGLTLSVSHCGRYIVTGGSMGVLRVYGIRYDVLGQLLQQRGSNQGGGGGHGRPSTTSPFVPLQVIPAHSKAVVSVDFSPGDKQVVSVGEDGSIFLYFFFAENEA